MPPTPSALYAERSTLPPEPSLWESFRIQLRVIGALLIRESLTRYGRHNIGFLWLFAEPMLFTLAIAAIWTSAGLSKGGNISMTAFMLVGYSTLLLWRNMPNRCVGSLQPNFDLLFHRQVKPFDIFLSRCILELAGATTSFIILGIIFYRLGLVEAPHNILKVAAGWFLLSLYAFSVSLLVGAVSARTEAVEKVWHISQYLMIPLSGSLFMLQALPENARQFLLWIPTVSCAELVREGYFGPAVTSYYDVPYASIATSLILLFALIQVRIVSRSPTLA